MAFSISFKSLPFCLDYRQVVYVENEYNHEINRYIQQNYVEICRIFEREGLEFIYIPRIADEVCAKNILDYNAPYAKSVCDKSVATSSMMLNYMLNPENRMKLAPSVVYNVLPFSDKASDNGILIYNGRFLSPDYLEDYVPDIPFSVCFDRMASDISSEISETNKGNDELYDEGCIRFSLPNYPPNTFEFVDQSFDEESMVLMMKVKEMINQLRLRGIKQYVLNSLVREERRLSQLVVTNEHRLFLPDYDNVEIVMQPLQKAVYLLFLNHPEGILFKCLPDYREELANLYMMIIRRKGSVRADKSLDAVTNPLNNSINEKCARIREAFLAKFDDDLAVHYYITGQRGCPKKIQLPSELVVREYL